MNANHRRLKIAVLAGMLACSVTGTALATPGSHPLTGNIGSIDLSHEFSLSIVEYGSDEGYAYLYYTPTDKTVDVNTHFGTDYRTFKGGVLYLVRGHTSTPSDGITQYLDDAVTALGNAQDIFGEGITEDEIKDLIANVEGDQTVDGNQNKRHGLYRIQIKTKKRLGTRLHSHNPCRFLVGGTFNKKVQNKNNPILRVIMSIQYRGYKCQE